jgi:protein-S-isoprenylcysteine O-methyltransferase Ste14
MHKSGRAKYNEDEEAGAVKGGFYIFPPLLTGINFSVLLLIGIIFVRKAMTLWDYVSVAVGGLLVIVFVVSLVSTHKIGQMRMQPEDVDKLVRDGPYQIIRHPNFTGLICMNIAYFLFFRTLWLVPFICAFILFWYLEARYEERMLIAKFRGEYRKYMNTTGMFFPKLLRRKTPPA